MKKKILRSHKVEILPNEEQRIQLEKSFGVARFAWNRGLDMWNEHYQDFINDVRDNRPSGYTIRNRFVKEVKPEFPWLDEVSKEAYANSILDLGKTWNGFFKGINGRPRFKKKNINKNSYRVESYKKDNLRWEQNRLYIPLFRKNNFLKTTEFPRFNGELKQVTISRKAGRYYASCLFDLKQVPADQYKVNKIRHKYTGIDVGSRTLAHTSDDLEFILSNVGKENKKIAKLQRKLSRQVRGSQNYLKTKTKLQRVYQKRSNKLLDDVHKTTNYLVRNYQNIAIEDLRVSNMMRNRRLANIVSQSYYYEFKRQLDYKINYLKEKGVTVELFLVDPRNTTKRCSECGQLNDPKSSKTYHCNHCSTVMDRDLNAAINIERKAFGLI